MKKCKLLLSLLALCTAVLFAEPTIDNADIVGQWRIVESPTSTFLFYPHFTLGFRETDSSELKVVNYKLVEDSIEVDSEKSVLQLKGDTLFVVNPYDRMTLVRDTKYRRNRKDVTLEKHLQGSWLYMGDYDKSEDTLSFSRYRAGFLDFTDTGLLQYDTLGSLIEAVGYAVEDARLYVHETSFDLTVTKDSLILADESMKYLFGRKEMVVLEERSDYSMIMCQKELAAFVNTFVEATVLFEVEFGRYPTEFAEISDAFRNPYWLKRAHPKIDFAIDGDTIRTANWVYTFSSDKDDFLMTATLVNVAAFESLEKSVSLIFSSTERHTASDDAFARKYFPDFYEDE